MLPTIIHRFEPFPRWKMVRIPKEATQNHFSSWQCSITYGKIGSRHVGSTQLKSYNPRCLLTRLGSFRSPLVCINGLHTCWAAIWFLWRCEEMSRWMFRSKKGRFFTRVVRGMGKMYNKRWSILWITNTLYHSPNLTCFLRKKTAFHTCTPDVSMELPYTTLCNLKIFLCIRVINIHKFCWRHQT